MKPPGRKYIGRKIPRALRRAFGGLLESVVGLIFALIFFVGVLWLLETLFPTGVSIREVVRQQPEVAPAVSRPGSSKVILSEVSAESSNPVILTRIWNRVKSRRAEAVSWRDAVAGMNLFAHDAVQTFSNSAAKIALSDEDSLHLGSNSLVVLQGRGVPLLQGRKSSLLVMVEGDLSGRLAGGSDQTVEITTAAATARFSSAEQGQREAAFQVSILPSGASSISVFTGNAEINAGGETVVLGELQGIVVAPGEKPANPSALARPLKLAGPEPGQVFTFRELPPRVGFSWQGGENSDQFRFMLARDPRFEDPLLDTRVSTPGFTHGNLRTGAYYWRVCGLRQGLAGPWSAVGSFRLEKDMEPPRLTVELPQGLIREDRIEIRGQAEEDSRVFVGDREVIPAPDGRFACTIDIVPGFNTLRVEAIDRAGNSTYRTSLVQKKP